MNRILFKYIVVGSIFYIILGFSVYTLILLVRFIFSITDILVLEGTTISDILELTKFTLPNITVLTIPMGILLGNLIFLSKLSADNEIVALESCGIPIIRILLPLGTIGILFSVLNFFLLIDTMPKYNFKLRQKYYEILIATMQDNIKPYTFYRGWGNYLIFFTDKKEKAWKNVLFAEIDEPTNTAKTLIFAQEGIVEIDTAKNKIKLHLRNAITHETDFNKPDNYIITNHSNLAIVIDAPHIWSQTTTKGTRSMTLTELQRKIATSRDKTFYLTELHKRYALSLTPLLFSFLAPLLISTSRKAQQSPFFISLLVIAVYYVLITASEDLAKAKLANPIFAPWIANLTITTTIIYLLYRKAKPISDSSHQLIKRMIKKFTKKRITFSPTRKSNVHLTFILFRYITLLFLKISIIVVTSFSSLIVIAEFMERSEHIAKNNPKVEEILTYIALFTLENLASLSPFVFLITTFITLAILNKNNEVTAFNSCGISSYRLSVPILLIAVIVSIFMIPVHLDLLPQIIHKRRELGYKIMGKSIHEIKSNRFWTLGHQMYIYNYLYYDPEKKELINPQIIKIDPAEGIKFRARAKRMKYLDNNSNNSWELLAGWFREFDLTKIERYLKFKEIVLSLPDNPATFEREFQLREELRYKDLKELTKSLQLLGKKTYKEEMELAKRISYPILSVGMVLIAIVFSFRKSDKGTLASIGTGLAVAIVYLVIQSFFYSLGRVGLLPPTLASWVPTIIVILYGSIQLLNIRS